MILTASFATRWPLSSSSPVVALVVVVDYVVESRGNERERKSKLKNIRENEQRAWRKEKEDRLTDVSQRTRMPQVCRGSRLCVLRYIRLVDFLVDGQDLERGLYRAAEIYERGKFKDWTARTAGYIDDRTEYRRFIAHYICINIYYIHIRVRVCVCIADRACMYKSSYHASQATIHLFPFFLFFSYRYYTTR